MEIVTSLKIKAAKFCKMNDYHIFLKHSTTNDKEWTVISYKETNLSTFLKGIPATTRNFKRMQYIISNELTASKPTILGIFSTVDGPKQNEFYQKVTDPDIELTQYHTTETYFSLREIKSQQGSTTKMFAR
jgi:hypothetical protein